jgi:hypothetical protein
MFDAVVLRALRSGIELFLHASSVHVEDTLGYSRQPAPLLTAKPAVFQTDTARGFAGVADDFPRGAVSLRLGGVTPDDLPLPRHEDVEILSHERRVWLSHRDLGDLVTRIIHTRSTPGQCPRLVLQTSNRCSGKHPSRGGWVLGSRSPPTSLAAR